MKKILLSSIAALSLLMVSAQAQPMQQGQGKGMMQKKAKLMKRAQPLLLRLPMLMKVIKKHENDPKLALTAEQKAKLEAGMKERKPKLKQLTQQILATQKEIRQAMHNEGLTPAVKEKVAKLAKLKEEATLIKLSCIDEVKKILSKEQSAYLHELRKQKRAAMGKKMKNKMKCAAGKCGASK
jgi:acyl transferase domain-containing protein